MFSFDGSWLMSDGLAISFRIVHKIKTDIFVRNAKTSFSCIISAFIYRENAGSLSFQLCECIDIFNDVSSYSLSGNCTVYRQIFQALPKPAVPVRELSLVEISECFLLLLIFNV